MTDRQGSLIDVFIPPHSGGMRPVVIPSFSQWGPEDGDLYVASPETSKILLFDGVTGEYLGDFVPANTGGLERPSGLTFGPDGNLYVGSTTTDRILRFDGSTGEYLGDFVIAGSGGLESPAGLVFGPDRNFYVASATAGLGLGSVIRYDGATGEFMGRFYPQRNWWNPWA